MKKVLFVFFSYKTGGVLSALINLLNALSSNSDLSIDLLVFNDDGPFKNSVSNNVKVIKTNKWLKTLGETYKETKQRSKTIGLLRLASTAWTKIFGSYLPRQFFFSKFKTKLPEYDVAISFTHDGGHSSFAKGCNDFVLTRIKAKKKMTFVHCDYSAFPGNNKSNAKIYPKFDKIVCVSNGCKDSFLRVLPHLSGKVIVCYNLIDVERVKELGLKDPYIYPSNGFNIVTVARLSEEKGFDRGLSAFKRISDSYSDVNWYIIGCGSEFNKLGMYIKNNNLEGRVFLIGEQKNPYRYLPNANLFLLPSYHECAPMVFNEASVFSLPVLTTKTSSAKEMVEDCGLGIVCENSENGIYNSFVNILQNRQALNRFKSSCLNEKTKDSLEVLLNEMLN